jgi:hypothetical protein
MDYAQATAEEIAAGIVRELVRQPSYRPVEPDGDARAAALLADLI